MLKYATAEILDARLAAPSGRLGLFKDAHRHEFDYQPRHGYLYVRSRMISSRCNDNYDEFPAAEIEKGFLTFIGKPVFVNHNNEDHRHARGVIIDAALHRDTNPDGSPDTWVEGLMEIDALRFPKLAKAILAGHIERTSMGVDVDYSICSACGNKATTPLEYCRHVPGSKGTKMYRVTASGEKVGEFIREACYGLRFFENSVLVEEPADPTAFFLGKVQTGPGLEHLTRTASKSAPRPAYIEPTGARPAASTQQSKGRHMAALSPTASLGLVEASQCIACRNRDTVADLHGNAECLGCGHAWHEATLRAELRAEAAKYDTPADHPWFQQNPVSHKPIEDHWAKATDDEKAQGERWYPDAHLVGKSIAKLSTKKHPEGAAHLGAGMLAIYSPQQGWAGNMHNAARVLHEGQGIGGKGSGMFASASQKKSADRLLGGEHYNDILAGPKIRDFAHLIEHGGDKDPEVPHVVIDRHALSVATGKRMSNDDYSSAPLSGSPRKDGSLNRRNYDHVVDQYHLAAKHISEKEGRPIAGHQVQATTWLVRQRLNQEEERKKAASGVDSRLDKGRERSRANAEQNWEEFRSKNLPEMGHAGPGTGYTKSAGRDASFRNAPVGAAHVAYGETKAPADVDTLRDESCSVCGEQDAWDGNVCAVCGFVAPPKAFQDPDLDLAKKLDLRKQQDAFDESMDPAAIGPDGQPIGDEQPGLVCDTCGTEFPAAEPMTTDTEDPQAGADPMESDNPEEMEEGTEGGGDASEGDVCPACGKGILVSATEMGAEGEEGEMGAPPEEGDEPDGDEGLNPGEPSDEDGDEEEPEPVDPRDLPAEPDDDQEDDESDDDDSDDDKPAKGGKNPFGKK